MVQFSLQLVFKSSNFSNTLHLLNEILKMINQSKVLFMLVFCYYQHHYRFTIFAMKQQIFHNIYYRISKKTTFYHDKLKIYLFLCTINTTSELNHTSQYSSQICISVCVKLQIFVYLLFELLLWHYLSTFIVLQMLWFYFVTVNICVPHFAMIVPRQVNQII